jgi:hypothetical protein
MGVKSLYSITYACLYLQNIHSKLVTGKIFFLKGLWVLMAKARHAGAFFDPVSIIAVGWN